jgi:hypothetical protein
LAQKTKKNERRPPFLAIDHANHEPSIDGNPVMPGPSVDKEWAQSLIGLRMKVPESWWAWV